MDRLNRMTTASAAVSTEQSAESIGDLPAHRKALYSKTFRLQGIPLPWNLKMLQTWLEDTFGDVVPAISLVELPTANPAHAHDIDLAAEAAINSPDTAIVGSLAIAVDEKTKTATASFHSIPQALSDGSHEWTFPATTYCRPDEMGRVENTIRIDDNFLGLTVLKSIDTSVQQAGRSLKNEAMKGSRSLQPFSEPHSLDVLAVSGLGGHAFGSFKQSNESHMWLRDSLPRDLPETRIMIYGYDTKLAESQTFQGFEELASAFRINLQSARRGSSDVPLVILGHSLGGIVVKDALHQMLDTEDDNRLLASIFGMIFFGVPSEGMQIESLFPIVSGQPNMGLLNALGTESPILRRQRREFNKVRARHELELFCFYETKTSPTASNRSGKWKMDGPPALLVGSSSATNGAIEDVVHIQGLNRDHSHLVKFSAHEPDYSIVLGVLKRFFDGARERTNLPLNSEEQTCLRTLSFENMDRRIKSVHKELIGTCHWLCERRDYQSWLESEKNTKALLWIKGKPGSGKSTLLKHAITCIEERSVVRSNFVRTGMAPFFFNARGSEMEQSPLGLFRGLVHNLFQSIPPIRKKVMELYSQKKQREISWSWYLSELMEILRNVTVLDHKYDITIFIDAFDECHGDQAASPHDLVEYFAELANSVTPNTAKVRICLSSRHFPSFKSKGFRQILVQDNNKDDIMTYMTKKLGTEFVHELDTKFMLDKKASGVFMWVVLIVERLSMAQNSGMTARFIRKFVEDLPRELDAVYKQQLEQVTYVDVDQAMATIRWILYSMQPMTLRELRSVLPFCTEPLYNSIQAWTASEDYVRDDQQMLDQLRALSGGLLEVSGGEDSENLSTSRIQFIHESAREFFLGENGLASYGGTEALLPGEVHEKLKDACLRYLNCQELRHQRGFLVDQMSRQEFPFLAYACEHILAHAARAEHSGITQTSLFDVNSGLGSNLYLWTLTVDNLGLATVQGPLKAVIASQARILALLRAAEEVCMTAYDRSMPFTDSVPEGGNHGSDESNLHITFLSVRLGRTTTNAEKSSEVSQERMDKREPGTNEHVQEIVLKGLDVQPSDLRKDTSLVASSLHNPLPLCRYSLAGRLTASINGVGLNLIVSAPLGDTPPEYRFAASFVSPYAAHAEDSQSDLIEPRHKRHIVF